MIPPRDRDPNADLGPTTASYLDNCCLAGNSFEEMLQRLIAFFNRLRAAEHLLKAKKCELFQPSVIYLGHKVCEEGIAVEDNKIEKVRHSPPPHSVQEQRIWLGSVTYYASFVEGFASICSHFYHLLHKNVMFKWTSANKPSKT